MKKILTGACFALLFCVPTATLAAGETIIDYSGNIPNSEEAILLEEINSELMGKVDTLSFKLDAVMNLVYSSVSGDPYTEKSNELSPVIEKVRSSFVNPAYDALYSGDEKLAMELLTEGENQTEKLFTDTKKWRIQMNQKNALTSLDESMQSAKNTRDEIALMVSNFSSELSSSEKTKTIRLEKLADYYVNRISEEYKKAKGKLLIIKDEEDTWQITAPVDNLKYRLEYLIDRFQEIYLGK